MSYSPQFQISYPSSQNPEIFNSTTFSYWPNKGSSYNRPLIFTLTSQERLDLTGKRLIQCQRLWPSPSSLVWTSGNSSTSYSYPSDSIKTSVCCPFSLSLTKHFCWETNQFLTTVRDQIAASNLFRANCPPNISVLRPSVPWKAIY